MIASATFLKALEFVRRKADNVYAHSMNSYRHISIPFQTLNFNTI
jgi:hypothetical protein